MDDESPVDGLMSRLSLIEAQPLETRATAFTQIHDQLQQQLDGKDAFSRNG
ncbi:hypothetical protein [Salinibacterium sp. SWN1162]|uniref:hypothetical protein n=1 Tax=Salinibacterium sp. SWN1162 TaxID=2792053 RepID=UPI0018CFD274|nr:hypothetical protein [Salinibacterium sp. SWN1162]MBH0009602.1 hypothetical protein [Salinibacterium sp. SWN1162]